MGYYSSITSTLGVCTRGRPCGPRRPCVHTVCRQAHGRWPPRGATRLYTTLRWVLREMAGDLKFHGQLSALLLIADCVTNSNEIAIGVVGRTST